MNIELDRLAEIRRLVEAHHSAVFLLEVERDELRMKMARVGWKAPEVETAA